MQIKQVVIAIQARSTSTRLPGKVFEKIGDKSMLEHVVEAAKNAQKYLNNFTHSAGFGVHVVICCPYDDPIVNEYKRLCPIVQGPEHDVLERYYLCLDAVRTRAHGMIEADYVVRITSDCPLIPHYLISKIIKIALINQYDYTSNVFPELRTVVDGYDCEVISRRALEWAHENATSQHDREHVTTYIRSHAPKNFTFGDIIGFLYQPHIKLSVDTEEDLENVREQYFQVNACVEKARDLHGERNVHRF